MIHVYKMPWKNNWLAWTNEDLERWNNGTQAERDKAEFLDDTYKRLYLPNRLAFFLAHGGGKDYLNDLDTTVLLLKAGNQAGKTYHALAWLCLQMVKCDKDWPCFADNGLKWRDWMGPLECAMGSYHWVHVRRNLWPKLCQIMPADELREYSPLWHPGKAKVKRKYPNWAQNPSVPLACGSTLDMFAFSQDDSTRESMTYQRVMIDEQIEEESVEALYARGTTASSFRMSLGFTPHIVPDMPNTGAGTWLERMVNGADTKGYNVKVYTISMDDVPDAIVSKEKKKHMYHIYIEVPRQTGNRRAIRSGRSRWYGEFETREGLVYDNFMPWLHVIEPFDIPPHWTRYRFFDPGRTVPFGGLWCAVTPWDDLVFYREYYQAGNGITEHIKRIIELSGNKRERLPMNEGDEVVRFRENCCGEVYHWSVMDGRTFASPSDDESTTLGSKYFDLGLDCIPGETLKNELAIPIVKEIFEIDKDRIHLLIRLKRKRVILTPEKTVLVGAPRVYFFNTLRHFRNEIDGYRNKPNSDKPVEEDDHLMTALKYGILSRPKYVGATYHEEDSSIEATPPTDRFVYSE